MKSSRQLLAWVALGIIAGLVIAWAFPRVYVLFPPTWEIRNQEAEAIALERLRDLGAPPEDPYVVTVLETLSSLEYRLQRSLDEIPLESIRSSRLARDIMVWEVTVWEKGAHPMEWTYQVRITPRGEVTDLRLRVPPDQEGGAIDIESARLEADRFLAAQGLDLSRFVRPAEARTRQLQSRTDLVLRYRDTEAVLGDDFPYGVEVTFAGDRLAGYSTYFDDPERSTIQALFQPFTLLSQGWFFVNLLLLPILAIPFVRRYHAGEIGVRRGVEIASVVVVGGLITMIFCARAASSSWSIGVLSREQITWVVLTQMMVLFFFPAAVASFLSWSVGESLTRERAPRRVAAFDALFKRDWKNSTFAAASLRGIVSGLAILAITWLLALALRKMGAFAMSTFYLGPFWDSAGWFAIPLMAFVTAYGLYATLFGRLLLVSAGLKVFGRFAGPIVASVAGALFLFPDINVYPLSLGLVFWILLSAGYVLVFLRYGTFAALLAYMTLLTVQGALPFLGAADAFLQFQASLALLILALPLILSARYLLSDRRFFYRYEDIPPHVRRIAERERQKVELETARGIQASILPDLPPELNGVKMTHAYLPATEVGGDFYDVLALEDGRLAVAVGDVAGHGVSSGLVMSMAKSALAVQVTFDPEVSSVFHTLNRMVFQSARKRLLATLCYAVVDPERREMSFASAGHLFPYRISTAGEVVALESVSYPLGVRSELEVRVRAANLESGDVLFLFSDGVVEAHAEESEDLFGFDRLEESLVRHAPGGVDAIREGVLSDLERFTANAPREDDLTLLILQIP